MKDLDIPFYVPAVKVWCDSFLPFLVEWVMLNFCHNDRYGCMDSAARSHQVKVVRDVIWAIKGSRGWEVIGQIEERHPRRNREVTTIARLYELCINSPEWKELIEKYPFITMSCSTFVKCLCHCCSPPIARSCVNESLSQQRFYMRFQCLNWKKVWPMTIPLHQNWFLGNAWEMSANHVG
jgi:hypothetical protein